MRELSQPAKVGVIIVSYNSNLYLYRVLDSLKTQSRLPDRVIIIDNASEPPPTVARWESALSLEVIFLPQNVGFAAANNIGIKRLEECHWIALLNPDAFPERRWLEVLLAIAAARPEFEFFACRQLDASDPTLLDGAGDVCNVYGFPTRRGHGKQARGLYEETEEIFGPCAAAALYRRSALVEVEGFDEDFFCYYEDVDLAFRLRLAGYRCLYVPGAVVLHVGSGVTGKTSDFTIYHCQRNIEWLYVKNMPKWWFWKHLLVHAAMSLSMFIKLCLDGRSGLVWKAKFHALRRLPHMLRKRRAVFSKRSHMKYAVLHLDRPF